MSKAKSPIWWHPSGQWCKKRKGHFYYFGTGDHDDALRRYVAEWPAIIAGVPLVSVAATDDLTVADMLNLYLDARKAHVRSGELTEEVWGQYRRVAQRIVGVLGRTRPVSTLQPADFGRLRAAMAAELAPSTLSTVLKHARAMFAFGADRLDRPIRMGGQFDAPSRKVLRLHRQSKPPKLLPAGTLRTLIAAANPILKAQVLLGLNAAFGAMDLSELRARHLAEKGWVALPRRKTGAERKCPLWPETAKAIHKAIKLRPAPLDPADADRVFLSGAGMPCRRFRARTTDRAGSGGDYIARRWARLCERVGANATGFYVLRHVFRTVADRTRDRPAIDLIMGHTDDSMAAFYREQLDDDRLLAVVQHVHKWLFGQS